MAIFKRNERTTELKYEEYIPQATRVKIALARKLIDATREVVHEEGPSIDLTCRLQLRDDCKRVEKAIEKVDRKICPDAYVDELDNAVTRLKVSSSQICGIEVDEGET